LQSRKNLLAVFYLLSILLALQSQQSLAQVLQHRETIGTSCFAGALLYAILNQLEFAEPMVIIAAGLFIIIVRELSIKFDWHLPKI
jgi:uncharacterized membrane protein YeiH